MTMAMGQSSALQTSDFAALQRGVDAHLAGVGSLDADPTVSQQTASRAPQTAFANPQVLPNTVHEPNPMALKPGTATGAPVERDDLPLGHAEWQEALDTAASDSLDQLAPWLELYRRQAMRAGLSRRSELLDDQALLHGMRGALHTVTAALEEGLPRGVRRAGPAYLHIRHLGRYGNATAQWRALGWESAEWPLHDLLLHRLGFVGGFSSAEARVAARCALQVLAEHGSILLPGFVHQAGQIEVSVGGGNADVFAQADELLLRWLNPVQYPAATSA